MKKEKALSCIALSLTGLALAFGTLLGVANNKKVETKAYYTPSTHYEVSDTASELASYYSSISDSDSGTTLLSKLQSLNSTKRKRTMGYSGIGTDTSGAVIYTDYDLNSTAKDSNGQTYGTKVASFYTKTAATSWNREHMWPNSHGGNNVEADILHTRPTISSENSSRGNSFYVEGKNSSSAGWDPYTAGYDAECRGECARVILYCVVAYSGFTLSDADSHSTSNSNKDNMMGNMNTLIKWHFNYLPNIYEKNRNDGAEYLQGNRNPFVDHPEYVARIWSNFNSTVSSLCSSNSSTYANWVPGNYCNYGSNTPVQAAEGVTISSSTASISVGSTTTLSATSTDSGTISWTTSDGSVASISSSSSASDANITVTGFGAGTATITASRTINGTQYSQTCTVTVTKVVSSLSKGSTSPTKTTYTAGESFDPTGLTITANYSDSTSSDVTSSVVWSPDPLTAGTTSVTGTFGGKTITITGLTVNAATEPEIIDNNSDLSVGDYVVLRTAAGVGVTGWNNNKDATVSETESSWKKFYVASASSSGFTLKDETANSFIANPGSSNQFLYGSAATCSTNSSGHLICNSRYLCKNGTNYRFYTSVGSYLPFFIYKVPGSSSSKTLSSISVATAPTKTTYTAGEYFDPTGLVITRTYSDSTSDTYTYANHTSEFTFTPTTSTALTTSNVSVSITYGGKSCNQAITVNAAQKTLSSISVATPPTKTSYVIDETFSPTGLVITRTYSDSTSDTYTYAGHTSEFSFSPSLSTPLDVGNTSVTISYGGKSCNQAITVTASGGGNSNEGSQRIVSQLNSSYYEPGSIYLSGSTSEGSASCDAFTVTQTKYGGSHSVEYNHNELYVYSSHRFVISPNDGYTITSVVITASNSNNASSVGGNGLINCTKNTSGSTVTLTPTDGNENVGFRNSAQSILNYVVVNYTYDGSVDTYSISASVSKTYYVGDTISISDITVEDNLGSDVEGFAFANDGYEFTYEDAASGGALTEKVFTNAVSYLTYTCSLTVQVQRKAREDVSTSTASVSYTDLPTTYQTSTTERTAASGIKFIAYNLAHYNNSSKMQFRASGGYFQTTEAMSLTSLTINNRETNALTVYGSTNGTSFTTSITGTNDVYDLTGYSYVKVMKNGSGAAYCASLTITYGGGDSAENLANYIMYEDTTGQCTSKLDTAVGYLSGLSSTERTTFSSSNDYVISTARERLTAWASSQGKTIDYSTGELSNSRNGLSNILGEESSEIVVVIVFALISVCSLSFFLILKRKRMMYR